MSKISRSEVVLDQPGLKGVSRYLTGDFELVELSLDPGAELFTHTLPFSVVFYVLQGKGIITLEQVETQGAAGDIFECPAHLPRYWRNIGTSKLKLLVMKRLSVVP